MLTVVARGKMLSRGRYCCIALYRDVECRRVKYSGIQGYILLYSAV